MKKKTTFIISMVMALTMAFSLAACKDNTGGGGGGELPPGGGGGVAPITSVTTVDGAYQYFENLPSGSSAAEVDNILQDAFGIDLTFPTAERIYSSDGSGSMGNQTYSYYVVTIDNTEQTGEGFYNSIKPTMVAAGYEGEDTTLSFGKVIGDIVYTFEIDGRNGWIRIQINAYEYVEVWNPQVNVPENLKVVYNDDGTHLYSYKMCPFLQKQTHYIHVHEEGHTILNGNYACSRMRFLYSQIDILSFFSLHSYFLSSFYHILNRNSIAYVV